MSATYFQWFSENKATDKENTVWCDISSWGVHDYPGSIEKHVNTGQMYILHVFNACM